MGQGAADRQGDLACWRHEEGRLHDRWTAPLRNSVAVGVRAHGAALAPARCQERPTWGDLAARVEGEPHATRTPGDKSTWLAGAAGLRNAPWSPRPLLAPAWGNHLLNPVSFVAYHPHILLGCRRRHAADPFSCALLPAHPGPAPTTQAPSASPVPPDTSQK